MHETDAAGVDELHALRARAYGPAADIDEDPAAMRRLEELEGRRTASAVTPDEAPESAVAIPAAKNSPSAVHPAEPQGESIRLTTDEVATRIVPAPPWRLAPGFKLLWVFSVVAAALIAASITWSVAYLAPVSVSSGAEQIATVTPSPDIDLPAGWFGAGASSQTWEYLGLVVFETTYGLTGSANEGCIAIVTKDQLPDPEADPNGWSLSGGYWSGCGLGSFPTTAEVRVDSSVPEEVRSEFPDGSVLQFVLDGDKVGVFLDRAD